MRLTRALVLLLAMSLAVVSGTVLQSHVATAAVVAASTTVAAEDAATQSRGLAEAYNLLLDHYVRPLDTSALLRAGWDNLAKEAGTRAATPGPSPAFAGDRAADLQTARNALTAYLQKPGSGPDGFVAAHAMIRGMVRFVDEGHTYFLDPQQYRDYLSWSRGDNSYVGIGVSVSVKNSEPHIVEVYDDTPAYQAGLRSGDVLVRINDQPVAGMTVDEMTSLVRGPAGEAVRIVVRRGGDPTELSFSVTRAEIHLQFVKDRVVGDDIGYVLLRGFPEPSVVDSIEQDVARFQAQGVHGLVLDLRGNSGGRIDVGTRLLSHFLPNGTTVYQEVDRGGLSSTHATRGGSQYGLPLVVLVDGGTASMGEIFAAAVQEHGAATIIGTNTAGSVAAAQVFGLPDGSGLQVTVFDILSSDGSPLNKIGVVPDEVIQTDTTDAASATDPALARAVEILHTEIANATTS
jgi:carboxyl-terminal processing protease